MQNPIPLRLCNAIKETCNYTAPNINMLTLKGIYNYANSDSAIFSFNDGALDGALEAALEAARAFSSSA
jgi:hypothetical protein